MAKSFQVPEPIIIRARIGTERSVVQSFFEFATFVWLDDPAAYSDANGKSSIVAQQRWQKVIEKFEATKPGDWITLEDQDYVSLKKVVEFPTRKFVDSRITMACIPFSLAVLGAVDKIPEVLMAAAKTNQEANQETSS
jgi:hypothetical protein